MASGGLITHDWSKLRINDGAIEFFLYMQDGSKVPWRVADTFPNRLFVNWLQVHDSPTTGRDVESLAKRGAA